MINNVSKRRTVYDLEERTFQFAKSVRILVKSLPKTIANFDDLLPTEGTTENPVKWCGDRIGTCLDPALKDHHRSGSK